MIMRFNLFYPYLLIMSKVSLYNPPINHERFEREFKNRLKLKLKREEKSTNVHFTDPEVSINDSIENRLLWVVSNPTKTFKLFRDYCMLSNLELTLHLLYTLVLFHLFLKTVIYTLIVGDDREKSKYLDSIYYPQIGSASKRNFSFNYLLLFASFWYFFGKLIRLSRIINISINNADEYKGIRAGQLNLAYLATFNLTLKEWISLWKHINTHERCVHSDEAIRLNHLEPNRLLQRNLITLSDRDAIFYLNPIDFEKCYEDSVLCNHFKPVQRFKAWHLAWPVCRISPCGLKEVLIVTLTGGLAVFSGYISAIIGVLYLELRSEFNYPPSIGELIYAIPFHWGQLLVWVRSIESILVVSSQCLYVYDTAQALLDVYTITNRAHKLVQIFKTHLETALKILNQNLNNPSRAADDETGRDQSFIYSWRDFELLDYWSEQANELYSEYNKRVRDDISTTRFLYHEFLSVKEHHTPFLNIYIIVGGITASYSISILLSNSISIENGITTASLMSSLIPIFCILLYCARMEREVSYIFVVPFDLTC